MVARVRISIIYVVIKYRYFREKRIMNKKRDLLNIFIIVGIILITICAVAALFIPNIINAYLFANPQDVFMDYFSSIPSSSLRSSYSSLYIYPPLCNAIFFVLKLYSGNSEVIQMSKEGAGYLRYYMSPMMVFILFYSILVIVFIRVISTLLLEKGIKNDLTVGLIALSVPFLFLIERGNIMILSLLGVLVFFLLKNSSKLWIRNVGYICLAIASAIKIYPAIFGLILMKDKKYREAIRLAVIGSAVFLLTFLLFCQEGLRGIPLFFRNISGFNSAVLDNIINQLAQENGEVVNSVFDTYVIDGCRIGYAAVLEHVFMWLGHSLPRATVIAAKVAGGLSFIGIVAVFFAKKEWQSVLLIACVLVGFQSRSYIYTAVFMIVPLILFLNCKDKGRLDYIYLILQILIFFPLPIGWDVHIHEPLYYVNNRSFNSFQIGTAIFLITIVCVIDVVYNYMKEKSDEGCIISRRFRNQNQ